jgi:hypothetical protein
MVVTMKQVMAESAELMSLKWVDDPLLVVLLVEKAIKPPPYCNE